MNLHFSEKSVWCLNWNLWVQALCFLILSCFNWMWWWVWANLHKWTSFDKTKLSWQVGDILKKTVAHVLLASLYISRHGSLMQTSNNQAGTRGEEFKNDLHLKCAICTDGFVLDHGKFRVLFLVPSRPNTIANQQLIVIWHYKGHCNATCHELSCLEAGQWPLWRVVRFDKIFLCPTSHSHLFLRLFDKMNLAYNADQS